MAHENRHHMELLAEAYDEVGKNSQPGIDSDIVPSDGEADNFAVKPYTFIKLMKGIAPEIYSHEWTDINAAIENVLGDGEELGNLSGFNVVKPSGDVNDKITILQSKDSTVTWVVIKGI